MDFRLFTAVDFFGPTEQRVGQKGAMFSSSETAQAALVEPSFSLGLRDLSDSPARWIRELRAQRSRTPAVPVR